MVYNNLLVNGKNSGYPLYISSTSYITNSYVYVDYNNYVSAGANLAYLGAAKTTLAAIKSSNATNFQNDINVKPVWKNSTDLQIDNSKVMIVPSVKGVGYDILGAPRVGNTSIGCYGVEPEPYDASLSTFIGLENLTSTAASPIDVVIWNVGSKPVDSAEITLYIDNVLQEKVKYQPAKPLAYLQRDTVNMKSYQLSNGAHAFMAYVEMLNDSNALNDTIHYKRIICDETVADTFIIGNSKTADYTFAQLSTLFSNMNNCGVTGDVTLVFEKGTYTGAIDLSSIADAMGDYHLTLTSETGNRNDVTISNSSTLLTIGSSNKNITVKDLTLQCTSSGYVIYLMNGCSDIDILRNNLLRDTTVTSTYYVIYNPSGGTISNVNINSNLIRGGYYGMYLYGSGSSSVNENINIDSNEIRSQYYYACYMYYTQTPSFCYNHISARRTNATSYWYGIYDYYGQTENMVGNVVNGMTSTTITYAYGMYLYYLNYYGSYGAGYVANNEIRVKTNNYGVYEYYAEMKFYHNTVYTEGTSGYCFYGYNYYTYPFETVGNQFIAASGQWAFYQAYGSQYQGYSSDYNNFYNHGGSNFVYANGSYSNIASLQSGLGQDVHSVSVAPAFENFSKNLKVKMNSAFVMPRLYPTDITKAARRATSTTMGAYEAELENLDATLVNFAKTTLTGGSSAPVYVTLSNMGTDTLKSATIYWMANGVSQTSVNWTGALAFGESTSVSLGNFTANSNALNNLVAWVKNPNGKNSDADINNDTVSYSEYTCKGKFAAGTYTVGGSNPDFANTEAMQQALYSCGISGPVVMKIRSGNFGTLYMEGKVPGSSTTNTVTLMADSGATVVFDGGNNGTGVVIKNLENTVFQGLTFGNRSNGSVGVEMQGSCINVTIRECNIYACTTATASTYRAFNYPNTSGSADYPVDVHLVGNNIAGGYYNMYLYYLAGSSSYMKTSSMYIDSNVLTDAYYYGIYAYYYAGIPSLSYNSISSRYAAPSGNSSTYYGLYSYYYKNYGKIVGNKFYISNTSTGYGMYLYYYQNYPSYSNGSMLVANNEIRMMGNGVKYGMYLYTYYSNMEIHHNSVFSSSETSTAYGAYLYAGTSNTYKTNFTRNLLYADGMTNYPLYLANTTASYNGPAYGLREWNNLYSADNVAYAGGAKQSVADLQSYTTQDSNTLNLKPSFVIET